MSVYQDNMEMSAEDWPQTGPWKDIYNKMQITISNL